MQSTTAIRVGAILGFLGVALGAFGAHGLKATLELHARVATWETAVFYHLVHAVVLLALGLSGRCSKLVGASLLIGVMVFSGSLYILALTNLTWLGAITPLGGVAFLIAWGCLAWNRGGLELKRDDP